MKKILSLFLFCVICLCSCGIGNNKNKQEEQKKEEIVEVRHERTYKDEAKDIALQAKEEYEINRNFEKARELFEQAVKIDNEEEWFFVDMARVKMEMKDYEGAIEDLKKAVKIKENNIKEEKQLEQR